MILKLKEPPMAKRKKKRVIWVILYDDGSIYLSTYRKNQAQDEVEELNSMKPIGRTFTLHKFIEA